MINGAQWYLLRTLRHREREAAAAIDLETFIPHEVHFSLRGRKLIRIRAPLFRQYVFVRFDIERDNWQRIRRVYWIEGIVSANEKPLRVPYREIQILRAGEQVGAFDATILPRGCRVRVLNGPFAGLIGEVRRASADRRIEILFAIMGASVRAQVDRLHVAKI